MKFITNSVTVKSLSHEKNEDSFICNDKYIVIADGMGGEACGDVASKIAVATISKFLDSSLSRMASEDNIRELMFSAISHADEEILKYVSLHPEADGMGTTVVLLIHIGRNLYVAWCGDSRCYYYDCSKNRLESLTTDHSYVQQLVNEGKISVQESFIHPDNNLITSYLGGGKEACKPEFVSTKIDVNGAIILCSDGLSGYCRTEEIECELRVSAYNNLPDRLLSLAINKGSDDDITIVTLIPDVNSKSGKGSILSWLKKIVH